MRGGYGGVGGGLETHFEQVQGVADEDADGAGDVAGPEVGGHVRCSMQVWDVRAIACLHGGR